MPAEAARRLVVGRLRKPHGLKGDCAVFPLTDSPEEVFQPGRRLWMVDVGGHEVGEALTVERGRGYHREWLLKFVGVDSRSALEALPALRGVFVAADAAELTPPAEDEVYTHELVGFSVRATDGTPIGVVSEFYDLPSGLTLEVQGPKREFLLPYRQEFVQEVDRDTRQLTVTLPEGLID
ncbi:MAG: 16S rRNA processing protein RimM [Gemmatimonadales bacterium]|nr:16S rRNA processing protein RimM [Gemmatimonadales bacterium]